MSVPPRRMHLDPTDDDACRLFQRGIKGPLLMLNLLRFRDLADYSGLPELKEISPDAVDVSSIDEAKRIAFVAEEERRIIDAERRRLGLDA